MTHLGTTGFDSTDYQHAIALGRAQATAEIVGWLVKQTEGLTEIMATYIMAGGRLDDPQYRQQLGQHQAYMRTRSFLSGQRRVERGEHIKA